MTKILVFIGTVLVLVVSLVVVLSSMGIVSLPQLTKQEAPPAVTTPTPQPITLTGLEIAKKAAIFLDKIQGEDGSFNSTYQCNNVSKECILDSSQEKLPAGFTIQAYINLFNKTQNKSYQDKAKRALEYYLQKCQTDNFYCIYNILGFYSYYEETGDERFKNAMLKVADEYTNPNKPLRDYLGNNYSTPAVLGSVGIKLRILYNISGDKKYLQQLENLAQEALKGTVDNDIDNPVIFKSDEGNISIKRLDRIMVSDLYLPAYYVTKNKAYLTPIIQFLDKVIAIKFDQLTKVFGIEQEMEGIVRLELDMRDLHDDSFSSTAYATQAYNIQEALLSTWDTPEHKLFTGDYGFTLPSNRLGPKKTPLINASKISAFLRMSDQQFHITTLDR